jgi:hypothetical protein
MKSDLIAYRERLDRFNLWEKEQLKNKTEEEKLRQFEILYNLLWDQFSDTEIENTRQTHLNHLISIQRKLMKNDK